MVCICWYKIFWALEDRIKELEDTLEKTRGALFTNSIITSCCDNRVNLRLEELEKNQDYYGYLDREGNWRPLDKRR